MNREEAEAFVYQSYLRAAEHQDYGARDAKKRRPDLTRDLLRRKSKAPCAVVTGSKGKGSACVMISQILQAKRRVGLLTSPHLIDFCERFQVNGKNISDDELARQMTLLRPEIDEIDARLGKDVCVSPMGIQAALALDYFHAKDTQFNVLECGKGAKYDDVNQVPHAYAVINSIFLEHTRELGQTVEEIAIDKAHVITGGQTCVYVAGQERDALSVIRRRAEEKRVTAKYYGVDFWAENIRHQKGGIVFNVVLGSGSYQNLSLPLFGEHQAKNCALAMALCKDVLGDFELGVLKERLGEVRWPGRMEVVRSDPFVLLDACIHRASCAAVLRTLRQIAIHEITLILGIPKDKDYLGVAREMNAVASSVILTKSQNPHYVFASSQVGVLAGEGICAIWTDTVEEALVRAEKRLKPIVILGTASVVSEVKKLQSLNFFI